MCFLGGLGFRAVGFRVSEGSEPAYVEAWQLRGAVVSRAPRALERHCAKYRVEAIILTTMVRARPGITTH